MKTKTIIFMLLVAVQLSLNGQTKKSKSSFQNYYVKVSTENQFYFELTNGETYIPIGANL
jgi:hypothetical protein